jgi:hypothetical protein
MNRARNSLRIGPPLVLYRFRSKDPGGMGAICLRPLGDSFVILGKIPRLKGLRLGPARIRPDWGSKGKSLQSQSNILGIFAFCSADQPTYLNLNRGRRFFGAAQFETKVIYYKKARKSVTFHLFSAKCVKSIE